MCHDVPLMLFSARVCVKRSAQASTGEPADAHLQGNAVAYPALVNGWSVESHDFYTSGSVGC
jgi:hypothetical protein